MVARPIEISTDVHPYDVVPDRPLPLLTSDRSRPFASWLTGAMHRMLAAALRTRPRPLEVSGGRSQRSADLRVTR